MQTNSIGRRSVGSLNEVSTHESTGGPRVTEKREKAPSLGALNKIKISIQAHYRAWRENGDATQIRSGFKKEIINAKREARAERLDQKAARELGLPDPQQSPTRVSQNERYNSLVQQHGKAEVDKLGVPQGETLESLLPNDLTDSPKIHIGNLIDRLFSEAKTEGLMKAPAMVEFAKARFENAFGNRMPVSFLQKATHEQLQGIVNEFRANNQDAKAEVLERLVELRASHLDPNSKVLASTKEKGFTVLDNETKLLATALREDQTLDYMRKGSAEPHTIWLLANGGEEIFQSSVQFTRNLKSNDNYELFSTLRSTIPDLKDIKSNLTTAEIITSTMDISIDWMKSVGENITPTFREAIKETENHILGMVANNQITPDEAKRAIELNFVSVVLRLVSTGMSVQQNHGVKESASDLLLVARFFMSMTNGVARSDKWSEETILVFDQKQPEFTEQFSQLASNMGFSSETSLDQRLQQIQKMKGLVSQLPEPPTGN